MMPEGPMNALIADTSAWIAYFGGEEVPLLEASLTAGLVLLPALVATELLGNRLTKKDRFDLEQVLGAVPSVGLDAKHFVRAGRLKGELADHGLAISARDAHVIQCAIDRRALILSRDPLYRHPTLSSLVQAQIW
ncbi:MAG: type II toxin-antitoxin system VapC family toxin [Proteobacteria bacterium]|nr:MAG: type II toxin-antitoxin system VapC family toxin [Pseudomonadota bacterium]